LEGTASYYNVSCIEDSDAQVWDYKNKSGSIDAHDGGGWCTPWISIWENGSL